MLETASANGQLVDVNGSVVNVDAAYDQFAAAKRNREHFNALNESRNNLFNVAREDARTGNQTEGISPEVVMPEDWATHNEWQQYVTGNELTMQVFDANGDLQVVPLLSAEEYEVSVNGRHSQERYITNHEALVGGMLMRLFPPNMFGGGYETDPTIDHPLYGNVIDHMHSSLGGMIDKEKIREIYDEYVELGMNSDPAVAAGFYSEVNRFGGEFIERLEGGHQRVMDAVNADSQGLVTYPQSERPAYVSEEDFNKFVDAVKTLDINEVLQRTAVTGDSIEDALEDAGLNNAESVSNVFVSWYTKDGVPTPALVLQVKGKDGQRSVTRNVKVDPSAFIAYAPGVVEGFGLNTLDNTIVSTALSIYNDAPGLARRTGKVVVPYNDGVDTNFNIEFTAQEVQRAGADGPSSINLNAGTVRISGKAMGRDVDVVLPYAKAMQFLHELGVEQGLQGDLAVANYLDANPGAVPTVGE